MLSLLSEWKYTKKGAVPQGIEFKSWLRKQFDQDNSFISSRNTAEIAQILRLMKRIIPDETTLIPLYESYKLDSNHEFNAWDYDRRAELMRAIETDAVLRTLTDKVDILERYNELHAEVYGFEADTVTPKVIPPKFFNKDGSLIEPETVQTYNANQMTEVLSSGSHDRDNRAIIINTYLPTEEGKKVPTFHQGDVEAATLVLHEGRHTMIDQMAGKMDSLVGEFKDNITILHLNTFGAYYLRGTDKRNYLNPCEQDAYNFQHDMEEFLAASPEERKGLILKMEKRRDEQLALAKASSVVHPQQALALAA